MTGANAGTMADFPQSLKDPSILILRAEFNAAHIAVDRSVAEVDKHIKDIEQAKADNTVPKEMLPGWTPSSTRATPCWPPWRINSHHWLPN